MKLPLHRRLRHEAFCSDEHQLAFSQSTENQALARLRDSKQQFDRQNSSNATGAPRSGLALEVGPPEPPAGPAFDPSALASFVENSTEHRAQERTVAPLDPLEARSTPASARAARVRDVDADIEALISQHFAPKPGSTRKSLQNKPGPFRPRTARQETQLAPAGLSAPEPTVLQTPAMQPKARQSAPLATAAPQAAPPQPYGSTQAPSLPRIQDLERAVARVDEDPPQAGLLALRPGTLRSTPRVIRARQPLEFGTKVPKPAVAPLGTALDHRGFRFAPGCAYPVKPAAGRLIQTVAEPIRPTIPMRALGVTQNLPGACPKANTSRMRRLRFEAEPRESVAIPSKAGVGGMVGFNPQPIYGASGLLLIAPDPESGKKHSFLVADILHKPGDQHLLSQARDFWEHAPRDLKLLAIAIPVLLGLAVHSPSTQKGKTTGRASSTTARSMQTRQVSQSSEGAQPFGKPTPAEPVAIGQSAGTAQTDLATGTDNVENRVADSRIAENQKPAPGGIEGEFQARLAIFKKTIAERAAVAFSDDFRGGLDGWQSRGDLASGWSFDANGFVQPRTLALYQPTVNLSDYDFQFLGLIDKKAMNWVVRAKDFDNYYVVRLVILKNSALPTVAVERYPVINGKAGPHKVTIAPIDARLDTLYRVSMGVHGDTFLLSLQGRVVDTWTDSQLTRGGIGFFSPQGETSRLRWVQVTHQYDMLGRLCAYLAPGI
jgi:hypothetical protein